jgi:hypothetical protein
MLVGMVLIVTPPGHRGSRARHGTAPASWLPGTIGPASNVPSPAGDRCAAAASHEAVQAAFVDHLGGG